MKRFVVLGLLAVAVACSNEEPAWRAATAQNAIPALDSFLAVYSDGNFADSAHAQLDALFRARASEVRPLTQVTYVRSEGSPIVLQDADGNDVASYGLAADAWLTIDLAGSDTVYSTPVNARGGATVSMTMCLDAAGRVLRKDGEPVLLEPFGVEVNVPAGTRTGWTQADQYGRTETAYQSVWACHNCFEETGLSDCVFVW